ncbi:MAG: 30S ribosomal protein S6 [Butyricicoccus sp.]|nr:30S ribosomal protein S6 [Butyricicoccus sp.]MBQ8143850.1 30S ribosomal protein S6 [Butyricicoccus sp.]MBQ8585653.1 30S ribosomal protein S6 [Butyricicoccus sp.]
MAKVTGKYEILFIVNPTLGEEEIAAVVEKFKGLVEANGTITKVEDWGKRRMAYAIEDLHEGYYTLIEFESAPTFPAELDRRFRNDEHIMRSMIITKD